MTHLRSASDQMGSEEAESTARSIIDPDGAEGVDAFLHKRTPIIR